MTRCPKCNSFRIHGPRYDDGRGTATGREALVYRCGECGYEKREPCADAKEKEDSRA